VSDESVSNETVRNEAGSGEPVSRQTGAPEPAPLAILPVTGIGEIPAGADLAALLAANVGLSDGDVVVLTSKAVSKAEGRVVPGDRSAALAGETDRTVAVRGRTSIVRTRQGLVMAAAGVDASNTQPGTVVLLPLDSDESARRLRERLATLTGRNVAVVVTDTFGRAWRHGQTDVAIGAAGLEVLHDYAGRSDPYGNRLSVTAPAVADEIAGAGDLVKGKLSRSPAAVVRGLGQLVLPPGAHGPGAATLVRGEDEDMFGYGAREAVLAALHGGPAALRGFGRSSSIDDLAATLDRVTHGLATVTAGEEEQVEVRLRATSSRELGRLEATASAAAAAMGWRQAGSGSEDRSEPPLGAVLRYRSGSP
jgi:coenzyme F420-0:L-glutamate ligase / coenzyme F420-1:gamma-L-glutamate ligase